jgi:hypothetical protein
VTNGQRNLLVGVAATVACVAALVVVTRPKVVSPGGKGAAAPAVGRAAVVAPAEPRRVTELPRTSSEPRAPGTDKRTALAAGVAPPPGEGAATGDGTQPLSVAQ